MNMYDTTEKRVDQIMHRAQLHAESLIKEVLVAKMRDFASRLKPTAELRYLDGMGTRFFCIVRPDLPSLYVSADTYYGGGGFFHFITPRTLDFVAPLRELLDFMDKMDNDLRLSVGDYRVAGTRGR